MDEDFDIRQEQFSSSEKEFENALRPLTFSDFSGQQQVEELILLGADALVPRRAEGADGHHRR